MSALSALRQKQFIRAKYTVPHMLKGEVLTRLGSQIYSSGTK